MNQLEKMINRRLEQDPLVKRLQSQKKVETLTQNLKDFIGPGNYSEGELEEIWEIAHTLSTYQDNRNAFMKLLRPVNPMKQKAKKLLDNYQQLKLESAKLEECFDYHTARDLYTLMNSTTPSPIKQSITQKVINKRQSYQERSENLEILSSKLMKKIAIASNRGKHLPFTMHKIGDYFYVQSEINHIRAAILNLVILRVTGQENAVEQTERSYGI